MINEQYYFDQYEEREADFLERIEQLRNKVKTLEQENEWLRNRLAQPA